MRSCSDGTIQGMKTKQGCKMQEKPPYQREWWMEGQEDYPITATLHISLY